MPIPDQKWNGSEISDRVRKYREIIENVEDDIVLVRALDILLGLKAVKE